jgi:hypothetical protein
MLENMHSQCFQISSFATECAMNLVMSTATGIAERDRQRERERETEREWGWLHRALVTVCHSNSHNVDATTTLLLLATLPFTSSLATKARPKNMACTN